MGCHKFCLCVGKYVVRAQTSIQQGLCGLYQNTNSDRAFSETDFKS